MLRRVFLLGAAAAALSLPASALAGGPSMRVGTVEDEVLSTTLVGAKANMTLLRLAGFDSIRVTAFWGRTQTGTSEIDRPKFRNLSAAAALSGIRIYVNVRSKGSSETPLTDTERADFARYSAALAREFPAFRDFIVGNEPNLNRFWMPQFGEDGSNVAAPAYLALLAETYDSLKAVSRRVTVIGGVLAPRGIDRPGTGRDTHSPTRFIRDLGSAYRASERRRPVMDVFAIHPYGDNSSQAPANSKHPRTSAIGLADYDKLVRLLGEAFAGTPQPGSTLPILYAEYGVETQIPARKTAGYTGSEPATTRPVDEATQAAYYREAIAMSFCQPNVTGILLLHAIDEQARAGWQSGLFYADRTAKASLKRVAGAAEQSRRGVIASCPGLAITPSVDQLRWPRAATTKAPLTIGFRCSVDCVVYAELERAATGDLVAERTTRAVGRKAAKVAIVTRAARPGRYRVRLTVHAVKNAGPARSVVGRAFVLSGTR